jgi:GntR family transcriptional regulator/MocR family aminotransferase
LAKEITTTSFAALELDSSLETPLYRQLYIKLRQAILSGQLPARMRLPSTRTLALELNISRNTVINAFDQLLAEGYLEGKVGAGTLWPVFYLKTCCTSKPVSSFHKIQAKSRGVGFRNVAA